MHHPFFAALCIVFTMAAMAFLEPGAAPQLLAPGVISTSLPEFATSFTPDGQWVFFNRTDAQRTNIRIFTATRVGETWSEAKPLSFSDGTWRDLDPFVAPDGKRLYFSSNRPAEGEKQAGDYDTWYVVINEDGSLGEPRRLPAPINTDANEIFVSVTRSGTFYFSAFSEDERQGVFRCEKVNGHWRRQQLTLPDGAGNPLINPEETHLFFVAKAPDNDSSDLYLARRQGDGFAPATHLEAPINTPWAEFAPAWVSGTLYFTSERPGVVAHTAEGARPPGDLYKVAYPLD